MDIKPISSDIRGGVAGTTVSGKVSGAIVRTTSKENSCNGTPQDATRPRAGSRDTQGKGSVPGTRIIFRRSCEEHPDSAPHKALKSGHGRRTSRAMSQLISVVTSCYPNTSASDDNSSKFSRSSFDVSLLSHRSSVEHSVGRTRHSFDEVSDVLRHRRGSLEGSLTEARRRDRRNSVLRDEHDDRGFLDRAFENAIGIDFEDDEELALELAH